MREIRRLRVPLLAASLTALLTACPVRPANNEAPTADAGADVAGVAWRSVQLDGSASYDAEEDPFFLYWDVVTAPAGSNAVFDSSLSATPRLSVDLAGTYEIRVRAHDLWGFGPADTVRVEMLPYVPLALEVTDAEYSAVLEQVVLVSGPSAQLQIVDPVSGNSLDVALPHTPNCVNVAPDGLQAAVGHDGYVTLVDLVTGSVLVTHPSSTDANDVLLANGYIYAFPGGYGWDQIRAIETSTGIETLHPGFPFKPGSAVRLHPGGTSIYTADTGVAPADVHRYDISSGIPAYVSDSPYHGDFPVCSELWISEDGSRIFTACGSVFRASNDASIDMNYHGSLAESSQVAGVSHSVASGKVLVLSGDGGNSELQLYDDAYLAFEGAAPVPDFLYVVPGFPGYPPIPQATDARFVFFHPDGEQYVVLIQRTGTSDFGLVLGDIDSADFEEPMGPGLPAPQSFAELDHRVVDAEYSAQLDRIVTVADLPAALHIIDPHTTTSISVPLPLLPSSVSVSPDGTEAAVGHDGWVSHVDLATAQLIEVWPVSTDAVDTVLAGNDFAYVFPRVDQWERIRTVDLTSGAETLHPTFIIKDDNRGKLHPDGLSIYGATNASFEPYLENYDISAGTPTHVHKSQSFGNYVDCGELWMSKDGARIFTSCGYIFSASTDPLLDLLPQAGIAEEAIQHLDDSAVLSQLALIPQAGSNGDPNADEQAVLYDSVSLTAQASMPLPDFVTPGLAAAGRGRFVFFDVNGESLHVLMQADPALGLELDYGLVSFELP